MSELRLTSGAAIRAHWDAIGCGWRNQYTLDVRPSPGGTLALVQWRQKSYGWYIGNLAGTPFHSECIQPGLRRATKLARRIEALRDADGQPFDFNAPDVSNRLRRTRTADDRTFLDLLYETVNAFNAEHGDHDD